MEHAEFVRNTLIVLEREIAFAERNLIKAADAYGEAKNRLKMLQSDCGHRKIEDGYCSDCHFGEG